MRCRDGWGIGEEQVVRRWFNRALARRSSRPDLGIGRVGAGSRRTRGQFRVTWVRRVSAGAAVLVGGITGSVAVSSPAFAATTPCTTAALISDITTANASNGTVTLTASCTYTLTAINNTTDNGGVGLPVITGNVTIQGAGATIARSTATGTPVFR